MENKKIENNLLNRVVPIVLVLAAALLILNNFMLHERGIKVTEAKVILEEELRPAELELVKIVSENCDSCFDIEEAVKELKNQNVNIKNEETISSGSSQGKEFISKYNIKKLPTIIVSGEIDKSEQLVSYFEEKGEIQEGNFIFTSLIPPYFDAASNQVKGLVSIKHIIDSSCEKCVDLTSISSTLEEQGVFVQDEQFIEYNSKEGQELIKKFGVKEVPAILISEEVDYYIDVKDALIQSGAINKEGFYAVHSTVPPYRDLLQNKIVGLVDVVYLTNNVCSVCYDVSVNRDILLQFGLVLNNENTYDINSPEGKQFAQKYNVKKAPIIILSPDAKYYSLLEQAWESVGTIESDGWFVMRNPELIGTYWDLEENKIVEI
ncbi:hypothetical protein HYS72_02535 [Candidatus Pacearchaeota archaeon]|nr:hypothetical protein [Candidatus Pacearchaeota archaeon]MBI2056654.1 hypothetical protein [Candidatus Pacearchaeota archaeon]